MLDKIKQAQRLWKNGATHGEIKEITGLNHEQELAAVEFGASAELVYTKFPRLKEGMKYQEIKELLNH